MPEKVSMPEKVLMIDDDPNILQAMTRQLRKQYDFATAQGGDEGLAKVAEAANQRAPFAVVICDMRMPGKDGIQVLAQVRDLSPDSVRIMLTGNADQHTAIAAINQGNIFRFLTKPCPGEELIASVEAGLQQYRLVVAERELLEKTLAGSIKVLADVICLNDPFAYAVSQRMRDWIKFLSAEFSLPNRWQLDIATMLVPLGQFAIPDDVLAKRRRGELLTENELTMFLNAPESARNLIANIPRLAKVAEIIFLQDKNFDGSGFPAGGPKGEAIPYEARMLKILKDLAEETVGSHPSEPAFNTLERRKGHYDTEMLARIRTCLLAAAPTEQPREVELPVLALRAGHLIITDIRLTNNKLILASNSVISPVLVERLRSLAKSFSFQEPIRVRI